MDDMEQWRPKEIILNESVKVPDCPLQGICDPLGKDWLGPFKMPMRLSVESRGYGSQSLLAKIWGKEEIHG